MNIKKFDIKNVLIVVLGITLILSFIFGHKNYINTHQEELDKLHRENIYLVKQNDSIQMANKKIDSILDSLNKVLSITDTKVIEVQSQIDILKKKRNEIPNHVSSLSANDVAESLSNYLNTRQKSKNIR